MLYYLMKNDRKVRITMNKKDILEIKRRFKKEACTFTRMCGCYVDADRNKITKIGEMCGSTPSAIAGKLSVSKFINNRCTALNGTGNAINDAYNTASIPAVLPESKN